MKTIKAGLLFSITFLFMGFRNPPSQNKIYNIIYVDNSRTKGLESLSTEMLEKISGNLDSMKGNTNKALAYFLSDDPNSQFTTNVDNAIRITNTLYKKSSGFPNSITDFKTITTKLFDEDLSNIGAINIYFFVTENYLKYDLTGDNGGILLNFLPKQLQALTQVGEEKVHVYIYYPKAAKNIRRERLVNYVAFPVNTKGFESRIKFHFDAI